MAEWNAKADSSLAKIDSETLSEILSWATGRTLREPDTFRAEPYAVSEYIRQHRLVGTAMRVLEKHSSSDYNHQLKQLLQDEMKVIASGVKERNKVLAYLSSKLGRDEIVALKGNTAARLCNDVSLDRFSWDIDILAKNPRNIAETMQSLGASVTYLPAAHEEVNLKIGDVDIDLHRYFPIVQSIAPLHLSEGGAWLSLTEVELPFEEILPHSVLWEPVTGTQARQLSPTYAAFISAMHMYVDYIRLYPPITRFRPRVRGFELYELERLISHDNFNAEQFSVLCDRFNANVVMDRLAEIHYLAFGDVESASRIGLVSRSVQEDKIIEDHLYLAYGFKIRVPINAEKAVLRPYSSPDLINERVDQSLHSKTMNHFSPTVDGDQICLFGAVSWSGPTFTVDAKLKSSPGSLEIFLSYPGGIHSMPDIWINIGYNYLRVYRDHRNNSLNYKRDAAQSEIDITLTEGETNRVYVSLSRQDLDISGLPISILLSDHVNFLAPRFYFDGTVRA
ncbi:nucleotidyltransferase family protein [Variovorax boronicumulans]|nr:nucleotidyltransferase family protein [Variovorax boronicumulans]